MITVKHSTELHEFETLEQAMAWAKELGYDINAIGAVLNHVKKGATAGYIQNTHLRLKRILEDIQNGLFEEPYDVEIPDIAKEEIDDKQKLL